MIKKLIIVILSTFLFSIAYAEDPKPTNILTIGTGIESQANSYREKNKGSIGFTVEHYFPTGFTLGGGLSTVQFKKPDTSQQYADLFVGYIYPVTPDLSLRSYADVGQCFSGTNCYFSYYILRVFPRWKINSLFTWDVFDSRYRNTFDVNNGFEAYIFGTGLIITPIQNQEIYTRFYKVYNDEFNAPRNGVVLEYKVRF